MIYAVVSTVDSEAFLPPACFIPVSPASFRNAKICLWMWKLGMLHVL